MRESAKKMRSLNLAKEEEWIIQTERTDVRNRRKLEGFYFDEDGLACAFAALGEPGSETFDETFRI
jgi:hypothetical protein